MVNGTSVWFATQDSGAEMILILINRSTNPLAPHVKIADLNGVPLTEGTVLVGAGKTVTLSVAAAIAPARQEE